MRPWLFLASLGLSCAFVIVDPATAQTYTVTDLGILPGYQFITPNGINESGDVTGSVLTYFAPDSPPGVPVTQAFLYHDGKLVPIDGTGSIGYGITGDTRKGPWPEDEEKRKLRIAGVTLSAARSNHAFLYEDHFLRDLGVLPGGSFSAGYAVNSSGEVAGQSEDAQGVYVAVLFRHGNIINLGTLEGGSGSSGLGINNLGDVTGVSYMPGPAFNNHAFLYHQGKMIDLGTLPGATVSTGVAVNDSLQATGTANSINFEFQHAFLWSKGKMIDLGTLANGFTSAASGINAWGQIVGQSEIAVPNGTSLDAFLYSDGHMYDLNDMIPPNSGWLLNNASAINDRGDITGSGSFNGTPAAFLLTLDCNDSKNRDCDLCRHHR
jgi:probable HAF family extracellular repeat protein